MHYSELDTRLQRIAVVGGAGKMGRGITLLLLLEMARSELLATGKAGSGMFCLRVIDSNEEALHSLYWYLKPHVIKWAEKNINVLRKAYAKRKKLVDNEEMIYAFSEEALRIVYPSAALSDAADSKLIFEAVIEEEEVKIDVLHALKKQASNIPYFFTNTSSIPVHILDERARLERRIIGFHFYNPAPMQPLVELITHADTDPFLVTLAQQIGARLNKVLVPANDVAGFIGNGHFIREVSYALDTVAKLLPEHGLTASFCILDAITKEFLLRPMGIIQLLDYVGLDICQKIKEIMQTYIPGLHLNTVFVQKMVEERIYGGQYSDGTQRDGFFSYHEKTPDGIYDPKVGDYISLPNLKPVLGALAPSHQSWKQLARQQDQHACLLAYFNELFAANDLGASLAQSYLVKSREIALGLVKDGVAEHKEDVNVVLQRGFAHLYGPFNDYY